MDVLSPYVEWIRTEHIGMMVVCTLVNWVLLHYYASSGEKRATRVVDDARTEMNLIRSEIERYRSEIDRYRSEIDRHRSDTDRLQQKIEECSAFIPKHKVDGIF